VTLQGRVQDFSLGARRKDRRPTAAATRLPTSWGFLASAVSSRSGVPEGFPLFLALRITSPDITIVDYHAAMGARPVVKVRGHGGSAPLLRFEPLQ